MSEQRQETKIAHWERQHQGLDDRIDGLMRRAYLTPSEQYTARILKKQKLAIKDRLATLRRVSND
jgi:uncharacterized protein YdcH (DUF465 family)